MNRMNGRAEMEMDGELTCKGRVKIYTYDIQYPQCQSNCAWRMQAEKCAQSGHFQHQGP